MFVEQRKHLFRAESGVVDAHVVDGTRVVRGAAGAAADGGGAGAGVHRLRGADQGGCRLQRAVEVDRDVVGVATGVGDGDVMPAVVEAEPVHAPGMAAHRDQGLGAVGGDGKALPGHVGAVGEEGLALVAGVGLEPAGDGSGRVAEREARDVRGEVHVVVDAVEHERVAADAGTVVVGREDRAAADGAVARTRPVERVAVEAPVGDRQHEGRGAGRLALAGPDLAAITVAACSAAVEWPRPHFERRGAGQRRKLHDLAVLVHVFRRHRHRQRHGFLGVVPDGRRGARQAGQSAGDGGLRTAAVP